MEITESKLKDILKEQRQEYQTHIGALAEDFHSKLTSGFEQIVSLTKSAEALTRSVSAIQEMVAENSEDLAIMKSDIQFIKQELKQKISIEEFSALEKRVMLLERR